MKHYDPFNDVGPINDLKNKSSLDVQVGGDHYKKMAIQPIEYNIKNNISFAEGNIIKYISRWKFKNGIEDLKKALHCLQVLIELEEEKLNESGTTDK